MRPIYLDNNATTPLLPEAAEAVARASSAAVGNPASQHQFGRGARRLLEDAREDVGRLLGAVVRSTPGDQVIFTSGGTEANNLAILGLAGDRPGHAVLSAIEHPSVSECGTRLRLEGWQIDTLEVTADGVVCLERLDGLLRADTRFVSIMLGNNETGVSQPVRDAAEICRRHGVPLHTDAVQVAGKLPIDFAELGVAALTVSAHKFHGPIGIGALLVRQGVALTPRAFGGFQQQGLRPGTESAPLAAGLRAALAHCLGEQPGLSNRLTELRDDLERRLAAGWPGLVIHGRGAPRLPHTSCVAFPGLDRQALVIGLDLAGVACSSGSACASGSTEPSPTLHAMGCPPAILESSVRFSLGRQTTVADVAEAAERILNVCKDLQARKRPEKMAARGRGEDPNLIQ